MSRYIDADALIEAMGEEPYVWTDSAEEIAERNQWLTDMGVIESAPSIDIVSRKPVVGYEGYYEVDMYGNVYSVDRTVKINDNGRIYDKPVKGRKLTASKHSCGYRTVALTRNGKTEQQYIHRIVAEAYLPNPQNLPFINHKDEDKANNFVGNLEWCTEQYNATYGNAREKHAEAIRGRKQTEEHRRKRSESMKRYWAKKHGERRE